jgi:hypothetical protein
METEELYKKRKEVIDWERNNRTLANRSALYSSGGSAASSGCKYAPAHDNTPGCGVGRLIEDKALCVRLDAQDKPSVSHLDVFFLLPLEVRELGIEVLSAIQGFHDAASNFIPTGLSEKGILDLAAIEEYHTKDN